MEIICSPGCDVNTNRERERDLWHAKYFGNDQFRLINVSIACSMTRLKGDNHSQFDKKKPINELQESSTIPMFSNCYESQSDFHLSFWFHFVQYLDTKLEFQTKYLLQRKNEQNSPVVKKKKLEWIYSCSGWWQP